MADAINRVCPDVIDCPGSDSPIINWSSEQPDPPDFIGNGFFGDSGVPPIIPLPGAGPWTATACNQTFISTISQLDADLQALAAALNCEQQKKNPPIIPGGPGPGLACCNSEQCCTRHTQNGDIIFCVPAGLFCAPTCEEANQEAHAVACDFSKRVNGSLSSFPAFACVGTPFAAALSAGGFSDITFLWEIVSGSPPPGITFPNGFGPNTITIFGTPTASGSYTFTARATNPSGVSVQRSYTICSMQINPASLPDGKIGDVYSATLSLSGCAVAALVWSIAVGALPDGLSLDPNTGIISGTPTGDPGSFHFTVSATASGVSCSKEYTLTVDSSLIVAAYWAFSESGDSADRVDSVASVHLIPNVTPSAFNSAPGKFANGFGFEENGSGDFQNFNPIVGEPTLRIQSSNGWSVFLWFKINSWGLFWATEPLIDFTQIGSPAELRIQTDSFAAHQLDIFGSDDLHNSFSPTPFSPTLATWYFLHVFFDPILGQVGYSINNGAAVMDVTPMVFGARAAGNLQLFEAWGAGTTGNIDVVIDEMGFKLDRNLTPAEVSFLYNSGAGRTWPL